MSTFQNNEDPEKEVETEQIAELASNWDLDGLENLYEKYVENGSPEEKNALAVDGFLSLFFVMDYDFACGKLTEEGIALLLPIVEKVSSLMEEKPWDIYSRVYIILLEDAIKNHPHKVTAYFEEAQTALTEYIKQSPEDAQDGYEQLAYIYDLMTEYHYFNRFYWEKAIEYVQKSIITDPSKADDSGYFKYLKLLYLSYEHRSKGDDKRKASEDVEVLLSQWETLRVGELEKFNQIIFSLKNEHPTVALDMTSAFHRLKEYAEWLKIDMRFFPEEDYLFWLDEAQQIDGHSTTRMTLTALAHLFKREGNRLERIDLLEAAIRHYRRLIEKVEDPAFEVYYEASTLEEIAEIHLRNKDLKRAEEYYDQATAVYDKHMALIDGNPSVLMHYTEYLERCYNFSGDIQKPTLDRLKELALLTEEQGEGMYSSPTMLRIRLALLEQDEEEAIFHFGRLFLLHELCVEDVVKRFKHHASTLPFKKLNAFLDDNLLFMEEVTKGYYLDHTIRWDAVKQLTPHEVAEAWEVKKHEIRNRKPLD